MLRAVRRNESIQEFLVNLIVDCHSRATRPNKVAVVNNSRAATETGSSIPAAIIGTGHSKIARNSETIGISAPTVESPLRYQYANILTSGEHDNANHVALVLLWNYKYVTAAGNSAVTCINRRIDPLFRIIPG